MQIQQFIQQTQVIAARDTAVHPADIGTAGTDTEVHLADKGTAGTDTAIHPANIIQLVKI